MDFDELNRKYGQYKTQVISTMYGLVQVDCKRHEYVADQIIRSEIQQNKLIKQVWRCRKCGKKLE